MLRIVENDLITICKQRNNDETSIEQINNSIGVCEPRCAGRPFRIHFLVSPYDLLDVDAGAFRDSTCDGMCD